MIDKLLMIILSLCFFACVYKKDADSCFTIYKVILRQDNSVADSIFINCSNKNLFFHKKMAHGKLVGTAYMLNNKLHGVLILYDKDGKTIISRDIYENGKLIKSEK